VGVVNDEYVPTNAEQAAAHACSQSGAALAGVKLRLRVLIRPERKALAPIFLIPRRENQPSRQVAVRERQLVIIRAAQEPHLRPAQVASFTLGPNPSWKADRRH